LDSDRTGFIITRSQEGTQLGGLTQPGRTEHGIRYHVPPCWALAGELARKKGVVTQERAGHQAVSVALCISLFLFYIILISIVVVTVCFICCSVKVPLSSPTSFLSFYFHSPPHLIFRDYFNFNFQSKRNIVKILQMHNYSNSSTDKIYILLFKA